MNKIVKFRGEYFFLSNFYPYMKDGTKVDDILIMFESMAFECSECAYQAAKTLDINIRDQISQMTPWQAVAFWKLEQNRQYLRSDWQQVNLSVMEDILIQKFTAHPRLEKKLLATESAYLEGGNDWNDSFWGVCNGVGENHLGQLLMKIRQDIKLKKL